MMDEMSKKAKKEMIKMLKKTMRDSSYGDMGEGLSKVTVAAKNPEDLEEGLSKAQEILRKRFEAMGMDPEEAEEDEEEMEEEFEEESEEDEEGMEDGGIEEEEMDKSPAELAEMMAEEDEEDEYADGGYESEGQYLKKKYKKAKKK